MHITISTDTGAYMRKCGPYRINLIKT